jgi:hypothetical protein
MGADVSSESASSSSSLSAPLSTKSRYQQNTTVGKLKRTMQAGDER